MVRTHPTPYPDVNLVLRRLLSDVQALLGDHFVGLYLSGSLASGGFAPQRSDIDFIVVTVDELPEEMLLALEAMHARITSSGLKWATKLEGSYIPQHALRRYDPAHVHHPVIRVDGSFGIDGHGSDWVIQYHIIREQGVVVAGPAPQTLIDPVEADDLRRATLETLQGWWGEQLRDPVRLSSAEYRAYAILTMCRILYTLQHGTIVRKEVAARWAQETLGERWAPLIEQGLAWPREERADIMVGRTAMDETCEFIQYTLGRAGKVDASVDGGET